MAKDVRVVILGGCRCGKTTLADRWAREHPAVPVYRTDDLRHMEWSEASGAAAVWLEAMSAPWLIEGVAMARALRKFLAKHPDRKPCDRTVRLTRPFGDLSPGQASMNRGEETVWREIEPELRRRGVLVKEA